jgi:hypothetical protein
LSGAGSETVVLLAGTAVALALPLGARVARRRFDPFEPLVVFALAWATMFVVRPAAVVIREDWTYWGVDIRNTLPLAMLLGFTGAVAFVAAYELALGPRLAALVPRPRPVRTSRLLAAAVALTVLATVGFLIYLPLERGFDGLRDVLGGRGDALRALEHGNSTYVRGLSLLFVPAAFLGFVAAVSRRTVATWALFAVLLALALARTVPIGSRGLLLPLVGGIVVLAYLRRSARPRALILGAAVLLGLLASYAILFFRYPYERGGTLDAIGAVGSDPAAVLDPLFSGSDAEMVQAFAAVLTVVPEPVGWGYGRSVIGDLVVRPVPREFWPDKPLTPAREVKVALWPEPVQRHGFDPALSTLLVFYRDLGIAGVLLWMAAFGALARALYEWLRRHEQALAVQAAYALLLWYVVVVCRDGPIDALVQAAFLVMPVALALAVAAWRTRPESEASRSPTVLEEA